MTTTIDRAVWDALARRLAYGCPDCGGRGWRVWNLTPGDPMTEIEKRPCVACRGEGVLRPLMRQCPCFSEPGHRAARMAGVCTCCRDTCGSTEDVAGLVPVAPDLSRLVAAVARADYLAARVLLEALMNNPAVDLKDDGSILNFTVKRVSGMVEGGFLLK